jgi:hypothetical protein
MDMTREKGSATTITWWQRQAKENKQFNVSHQPRAKRLDQLKVDVKENDTMETCRIYNGSMAGWQGIMFGCKILMWCGLVGCWCYRSTHPLDNNVKIHNIAMGIKMDTKREIVVACTVKEQHPYEHCKLKWAKGETFCQ